ncbi:uncharacterized protein LOC111599561 [Drosophila hydei]|uniref:Uncharacterized protein LOC111599561 n=1 Tax=Drosophila hydei TaxID=7224 RepID=A0A6J2SUR9_DROHY|nr:uncharacterized protein LOC111599561 [Drosophila hydei]
MEATTAKTAYALFLHRSELQRRKVHYAKKSQTKIQLTNELIAKVKQRMATCSYEDLQILVREQQFKRLLEQKLRHRAKQLKAVAKQNRKQKLKRLQ